MSADHVAVQLALRARLRTLSICTTGSTTLEATAAGYARASGSFVTDGFREGMEATPTGFTQTDPGVVIKVAALLLTIRGGRNVEASGAGRTLAVGLPSRVAWDNVAETPDGNAPYVEEDYVPATSHVTTVPVDGGRLEDEGLYVLRWYGPTDTDVLALRGAADAVLALFKAGTGLVVGSQTVRVRSNPLAPFAGQIMALPENRAVVTITIPWRVEATN